MKLSPKFRMWLKRFGWAGFIFFLLKGLLWIFAGKFIYDLFNK